MTTQAPSPSVEQLAVYRRASNYIAAAMIYLQGNHMLEEPLTADHIKPRLLGHWGTVPGINLVYAGLNRLILETDASVLLVTGPGHGAPANLANLWIDGCLEEIKPELSRNREGLGRLVRSFSWPGGFPSHINVSNLFVLANPEHRPDGMPPDVFSELFTDDKPVIFNFHGYPSAVHQLIHRRPHQERFHVRGYIEEGTTTTPFDLLAMNGVDRFQLAIEALKRADISVSEMARGMSGAFAARSIPGARAAIESFAQQLQQTRRQIREDGDDPPEIKGWTWSSGEPAPA